MDGSIALLDTDGCVLLANGAWNASQCPLRVEPGDSYLIACRSLDEPEAAIGEKVARGIEDVLSGSNEHFVFAYPMVLGGAERWSQISVTRIDAPECSVVVVHSDITAKVHEQHLLKQLTLYDELTNLPNRTLFLEHGKLVTSAADRHGRELSLVLIELTDFADVAPTFGEQVRDELLQTMAARIRARTRSSELLCHLGDGCFCLLVEAEHAEAEQVVADLKSALCKPFAVDAVIHWTSGANFAVGGRREDETLDLLIARLLPTLRKLRAP